jgi:hypothetical protein
VGCVWAGEECRRGQTFQSKTESADQANTITSRNLLEDGEEKQRDSQRVQEQEWNTAIRIIIPFTLETLVSHIGHKEVLAIDIFAHEMTKDRGRDAREEEEEQVQHHTHKFEFNAFHLFVRAITEAEPTGEHGE